MKLDKSKSLGYMSIELIKMINSLVRIYLSETPSMKYDTQLRYKYSVLCKNELHKKWNYYNCNKSNTTPVSYYVNIIEKVIRDNRNIELFNRLRLLKIKKIKELI